MRIKPTTIITGRTKPNTIIRSNRGDAYFLWSENNLVWEASFEPWTYQTVGRSTTFTKRADITTVIESTRTNTTPLWSENTLPWESSFNPWLYDFICQSEFESTRKTSLLMTENSLNFELESGDILGMSDITPENIITTLWN